MIDENGGFWYYDIHKREEDPLKSAARVGLYWDQEPEDKEKKEEKGYAIQAKDVIILDAPKVMPSPSTPFVTNAKDYVGAINEIAAGAGGILNEDSIFNIQTYVSKYASGRYTVTEDKVVRLKLFKGPSGTNYYSNYTAGNISYDYVYESWNIYGDTEDPDKSTGLVYRTIYLQINNRGTPTENCNNIYFSKWGLRMNSNWYSEQDKYIDRKIMVYGFG